MMKTTFLAIGLMLAELGVTAAWADTTYSATTSQTINGVGQVAGTAAFDISSTGMTITLTDTTPSIVTVGQVLDGLDFTVTGGSGLALTSVTASGFIDCTTGTCTAVSSFDNDHTNNPETSPYGWSLAPTYHLAAGNGSYKPAGIVNPLVKPDSSIPNDQHNDYLTGPVTFDFSFTTAPTAIKSATFYWGTTPNTTSGTVTNTTPSNGGSGSGGNGVPDGGMTLMLLGGALVGVETLRRRLRV